MWFKIEDKRGSIGQKFLVRFDLDVAGSKLVEERPAQGVVAALKTAELLASSLNATATVYGRDAAGEFVYGVPEGEEGAGPARSAFLSSFFTLVGLHGAHVTAGLLWLLFLMAQVAVKGRRDFVLRRFQCFSLFWHALDIIWVALLTLVYLLGVRS